MARNQQMVALATGVVGVVAIGISIAILALPQFTGAADCFHKDAVLDFEFATRNADLEGVFHAMGASCEAQAVATMDQANRLDVFAFIPAYTVLNLLAVAFVARRLLRPLSLIAMAAAVGAAVGDYVETLGLLTITRDLWGSEHLLGATSGAATAKFALLSLHATLLAVVCLEERGKPRWLGWALLLTLPGFIGVLFDASRGNAIFGYVVAWVAMTAAAFLRARRPA